VTSLYPTFTSATSWFNNRCKCNFN
jgi:hypothetical protein